MTERIIWFGIVRGLPAQPVALCWSASDGFSGDQAAVNALRSWCTGRHRPHQPGSGLPSPDLAGWGDDPHLAAEAAHNIFVEGYERLAIPELADIELPDESDEIVRI